MKANQDIRDAAQGCHVRHWEIAKRLGHPEEWLSRKLRSELPENEKFEIFAIIGEIAAERES